MRSSPARSLGDLEDQISQAVHRFERELTGQGPEGVRSYLVDDLVVVRLEGALTVIEQRLVERQGQGPRLVKQVRQELVASKRPLLREWVQRVLGVRVCGVFSDINLTTGEGLLVLTLEGPPTLAGEPAKGERTHD